MQEGLGLLRGMNVLSQKPLKLDKDFLVLHTPCQFYGNEVSQNKNNLIKRTTKHEFSMYSGRFFLNINEGRVL